MIEFIIKLTDSVSAPAKKAAASLTSAARQAKALQVGLVRVDNALTRARALGDTSKVEALTAKHAAFSSALQALEPQLASEAAASQGAGAAAEAMGTKIASLGGPIGLVAAGFAALGAAAVAVGVAFVALAVKGAELAVEMGALREQTLAVFSAYAGGRAGAESLVSTLDALRSSLGMTRAEMVPLTNRLLQIGVKAGDVAGQLTALASIKALGIEGGEEKYLSLLAKVDGGAKVAAKSLLSIYEASGLKGQLGTGVDALAKKLKSGQISAVEFQKQLQAAVTARGADALSAQANSLSATWARLKENVGLLFEGVDFKPFLAGLRSIADLFGQDKASGVAMKGAVTGAFNAILSAATKVLPYIKVGIEYVIIFALKLYIALRPLVASLRQLWTSSEGSGKAAVAMRAFAYVVGELAGNLLASVKGAVNLTMGVISLVAWLGKGATAAEDLIAGLVAGISNGTGAVIDAIKGLGTSAISALKGVLHISSPSRVMAQLGSFTAEGFAVGIASKAPTVAQAATGMAGQATAPAAAAKGGATSVGGNTYHVALHIDGAGKDWQTLTEEAFSELLEKITLMQGVAA